MEQTVVLLHSLATSSRVWDPVVAELAKDHRVIVPDTRGHGAAPQAAEVTVDDWVADIHRLLTDNDVQRAVLVGVSMGGIQALGYAAAHPERVAGLVVADSFAVLPQEIARQRIDGMVEYAAEHSMADVAEKYCADTFLDPRSAGARTVAEVMAAMDKASYLGAVRATFGADVTDRLAAVAAPTLVLWGDRDQKTPRPLSEAIAAGVPGAHLDVLPDAGHLSNIDNPPEFAAAVRAFVTGLDQKG